MGIDLIGLGVRLWQAHRWSALGEFEWGIDYKYGNRMIDISKIDDIWSKIDTQFQLGRSLPFISDYTIPGKAALLWLLWFFSLFGLFQGCLYLANGLVIVT